MSEGKIRRNVDLRITSFALAVLRDNPGNAEIAAASRMIAASCLQLIGGYRALVETCRAMSTSEGIRRSMEPANARRVEVLFAALAESLEEHRNGGLQELIETMVVFAKSTMDDEGQHSLTVWAHSLGLCTEDLAVHDEDDDNIPVVEIEDPIARRIHKPRQRATREAYREDRYEDLVREAIAKGFTSTEVNLAGSRIRMYGVHPRSGRAHLRWLRCTTAEASELSEKINKELRSLQCGESSAIV